MKLKTFHRIECQSVPVGNATITLMKSGAIGFSKAGAKLLNIDTGDSIKFHQDEDRPQDWYISKTDDAENGFTVRGIESLMVASRAMCTKIKLSIKLDNVVGSIRFNIGKQPFEQDGVKYYPMITKNPMYKD